MGLQPVNDDSPSHKYEVIFCIFLVLVAFLYRDNSDLIYPQVLYLFLLLLTLNLLAGIVLRLWPQKAWLSTLAILGNCATITGILYYSGAQDSNLWVLFLLPIYTVCILLGLSEVVLITAGVLSFNLAFAWLFVETWDAAALFYLAIKVGIFLFAAAATWTLVSRDKGVRLKVQAQRAEIVEIEAQLREQSHELERSTKMADIGQMTSGVAHDLNNPITVIIGTVRMMLEDPNIVSGLRPDLERINRAAQLCKTITVNLLHFARDTEFKMVTCDLHEVIQSAFAIYESALSQSGIVVRREWAPSVPPVAASVSHLQRVFLNLMANARAAMKSGGVLEVRTRVLPPRGSMPAPVIQVSFDDSGPGISDEAMAKLFKPFNTTKGPEGTGLGLYLCREIALKHNGSLIAENRPEGGARFVLTLPSVAAREEAA